MKKLFGGGKSKAKANGSTAREEEPAAPTPTPIHAKLATTNYLTKQPPQHKQQRQNDVQLSPTMHQPASVSPTGRGLNDDERWETVTPYIVDMAGQQQAVPPMIPASRTSSYSSIPPAQPIPARPESPALTAASFQSNRHQQQYTQSPPKKPPPTAPVALGILSALDPPRTQEQQRPPRAYPDEQRYIPADRQSISDTGHLPREEKKEKRSFWGSRDRPKDQQQQQPAPREHRSRDQQEDPVNDLTRRIGELDPSVRQFIPRNITDCIGYLIATASEDFSLVYDVCDRASASEANAKEAVRALRREFKYGEPTGQLSAARLWAIMLHNSSPIFVIQSRSRKFLETIEDLITNERTTSPVVRERLLDVVAAAAYATRHHARPDGFQSLWRRVKPADKPIEGVPFDTEDAMFNPAPALSSRGSQFEVPYSAQQSPLPPPHHHHQRDPPPPAVNPPRRRKSPTRNRIIPVEEDIRRLTQECKIGRGNAGLLSEALLASSPDEVLASDIINEFNMKCRSSQELIFAQIPWATAQAERSRLALEQEHEARQRTLSNNSRNGVLPSEDDETVEEKLLADLLSANAELVEAFRQYDDLIRLAEEQKAEDRSRREGRGERRNQDAVQRSDRIGGSTGSSRSPSPSPGSNLSHTTRPQALPLHQQPQQQPHHLTTSHSHQGHGPAQEYYDTDHAAAAAAHNLAPPPNAPHGPRSPGQFSIRSRTPSPSLGSQKEVQMYVTSTTTNANGNTNGHAARSLHGHGHSGSVTSQGGGGGGRYYGGEYGGNGNERGGVYNNSNHHQQAPQHQQQQQHGYGNHPYQHHHQQQQHQPSEDNNGTTTTYSPYDQQQQQRSSYERDSVYGDRDGDGDGGLSEDDGAPVRPSAKALGKRKVVDDGEADEPTPNIEDQYLDENGEVNLDDPRFQLDAALHSDEDDVSLLLNDGSKGITVNGGHHHHQQQLRNGVPGWPVQPVQYVYDAAAERTQARLMEAHRKVVGAGPGAGGGAGGAGVGGAGVRVNGVVH